MVAIPDDYISKESGFAYTDFDPPTWIANFDRYWAGQSLFKVAEPQFLACSTLGRRVCDLEWHTHLLSEALTKGESPWKAASLSSSILVGYFSTGKALLDAIAVGITELCPLSLGPGDQDLRKERFWTYLSKSDNAVFDNLRRYRAFVQTIAHWRDQAIHRHPPRVRVRSKGPPWKLPINMTIADVQFEMPTQPSTLDRDPMFETTVKRVDPLETVFKMNGKFRAMTDATATSFLNWLDTQTNGYS